MNRSPTNCTSIPDLLALRLGSTQATGKIFYVADSKPSRRYGFIRDATGPRGKKTGGNITFEANWKRLDDKAFAVHVNALAARVRPFRKAALNLNHDTVLVKIFQHDMTEVTTVTTPYLKTPLNLELIKPIVLHCLLSSHPDTAKHVPLLLEIGDFKNEVTADQVALSFMGPDTAAVARKHSQPGGIYIVEEHMRNYVPVDSIRYRYEQQNIASLRILRSMLENILRALSAVATALGDPCLDHGAINASNILYDASANCAVLTSYLDLIYYNGSSGSRKQQVPYSVSSRKEAVAKTASRLSCCRNQLTMVFNKKVSLGQTFAKHLCDNGGTLEDADSVLTATEMSAHKSVAALQVRLIAMAIYCSLAKSPRLNPLHVLSFKEFALTGANRLPATRSGRTVFDHYIETLYTIVSLG